MNVAVDTHEPLVALNITPLIDVLLVLLVMMILTIPIMTNEVPIDLPGPGPAATAPVHRLTIDRAGALHWDGAATGGAALDARLRALVAANQQLTFAPDAATRYERVDAALAQVKRAGVTRLGFEGNDRYAEF